MPNNRIYTDPDELGIRGRIVEPEPSLSYRIAVSAGFLWYLAMLGLIGYAVWHYAPMALELVKRLQ